MKISVYIENITEMYSVSEKISGSFVMVWPTIVFPCSDGPMYWSYCQGLALMDGASAWEAHPDALEFYGPYETTVEPIEIPSSTVVIEELSDVAPAADVRVTWGTNF